MPRLYRRNELAFALVCVGAYVLLMSAADAVSDAVGVAGCITAPLAAAMAALLLGWVRGCRLSEKYGLVPASVPARALLYYLPLPVMVSVNLWGGFAPGLTPAETALGVGSMLCVGFLEEVIFRGLLFGALRPMGEKRAVIISSVTFGLGHAVNLLQGADFVPTLLQVVYAAAAGFLFTVLFMRTGSLLAPIAAHSALNALSVFAAEGNPLFTCITALFLTAVSLLYALYILRRVPAPTSCTGDCAACPHRKDSTSHARFTD